MVINLKKQKEELEIRIEKNLRDIEIIQSQIDSAKARYTDKKLLSDVEEAKKNKDNWNTNLSLHKNLKDLLNSILNLRLKEIYIGQQRVVIVQDELIQQIKDESVEIDNCLDIIKIYQDNLEFYDEACKEYKKIPEKEKKIQNLQKLNEDLKNQMSILK